MTTRMPPEGPILPSLAAAIQFCRRGSCNADLVAVVVDATVAPAPVPRRILWLRDDSLPEDARVAVSVKMHNGSHSDIRVSDIVRLNRVRLVSSDTYAGTTIAHFATDAGDPASAVVRLGRIDDDRSFRAYEPQADAPLESRITHVSCIDRLVAWHAGGTSGDGAPLPPPLASPLPPCRFQPLAQLPAPVGATYHTRARVLRVERRVGEASWPLGQQRPRYRRRRVGGGGHGGRPTLTYALLRDGLDATVAFVGAGNAWTKLLENAQATGQPVHFYHVQTGHHNEEVVLLPTKDTRLVIQDDNHGPRNPSPTPPNPASQFLLSLTQQGASQDSPEDDPVLPEVFTAAIESLSVRITDDDGKTTSLAIGMHSDEEDYDKLCYRLVKTLNNSQAEKNEAPCGFLTLSRTDDEVGLPLTDVTIQSNSSVLWCLLGGYREPPGEARIPLDKAVSHALLRSIVDQKVPLRWTLERAEATEAGGATPRLHAVSVEYAGEL